MENGGETKYDISSLSIMKSNSFGVFFLVSFLFRLSWKLLRKKDPSLSLRLQRKGR